MTKTDVLHGWFENLWNRGDESTIDQLAALELVGHGLGEGDLVGREAFRTFYRTFRSAFPSVQVTLDRVLESGDYATGLARVEVTAADGRGPFRFEGSITLRIANGQILEGWNYFDFLSLLTQMEVVSGSAMSVALGSKSKT